MTQFKTWTMLLIVLNVLFVQLLLSDATQTNIALNKPYKCTKYGHYETKYINDGVNLAKNNADCYFSCCTDVYVMIDLGAVYNLKSIQLYTTYWNRHEPDQYDIVMSSYWRECISSERHTWSPCATTNSFKTFWGSYEAHATWNVTEEGSDNCQGRYFAFRRKDPALSSWFKICELEIFGDFVANSDAPEIIAKTPPSYITTCDALPPADNIALNKPLYTELNHLRQKPTDGSTAISNIFTDCFFDYSKTGYVFIDLGAVYKLSLIRIWNSNTIHYGRKYTLNIGVGKDLRLQYGLKQAIEWVALEKTVDDLLTEVILPADSSVEAQFVVIYKPLFKTDLLVLCEVEVMGTLVPVTPIRRPEISTEELSTIPNDELYPLKNILLKDVSTVYVEQYSNPIHIIDSNCEGILWDTSKPDPYAVACTYGAGRVFIFGKHHYWNRNIDTKFDPQFKTNLYNWLSPSKKSSAKTLKWNADFDAAEQGDIIHLDGNEYLNKTMQNKLFDVLASGKFGMVIDITYWYYISYKDGIDHIRYIEEALGIKFNKHYTLSGNVQFAPRASDYTLNKLSLVQQLEFMAKNHEFLIEHSSNVMSALRVLDNPYVKYQTRLAKPIHDILQKYYSYMHFICPAVMSVYAKNWEESLIFFYNDLAIHPTQKAYPMKMPCYDIFPGPISKLSSLNTYSEADYATISASVTVDAKFADEIHPLGLYVPAGEIAKVTVTKITGKWKLSINAHSDRLFERYHWSTYYMRRYPQLNTQQMIVSSDVTEVDLYSPFGGTLMLENTDSATQIEFRVSGVVRAEIFDIKDPNRHAIWNETTSTTNIQGISPWAECVGRYFVMVVPRYPVGLLSSSELEDIVNIWDDVISLMNILRGTRADDFRRLRVVADMEPNNGYAHSGYPIVTSLDWFPNMFHKAVIENPNSWGVVHEFGHEMTYSSYTPYDLREVTVNLFADFVWFYKWKVGLYSGNHEKFTDQVKESIRSYFSAASDPPYATLAKQPLFYFIVFGDIAHHCGWGLYQQVLTNYTVTKPTPSSDQHKLDMLVEKLTYYSGMNLLSYFDFWNVPVSTEARTRITNLTLPCFLPDDTIAKLATSRHTQISSQYGNACLKTPVKGKLEPVIPDNVADRVLDKPVHSSVTF